VFENFCTKNSIEAFILDRYFIRSAIIGVTIVLVDGIRPISRFVTPASLFNQAAVWALSGTDVQQ